MRIPIMDTDITLEKLIEESIKKNADISISVSPDNVEIRISPYVPFSYNCPYSGDSKNGKRE